MDEIKHLISLYLDIHQETFASEILLDTITCKFIEQSINVNDLVQFLHTKQGELSKKTYLIHHLENERAHFLTRIFSKIVKEDQ